MRLSVKCNLDTVTRTSYMVLTSDAWMRASSTYKQLQLKLLSNRMDADG